MVACLEKREGNSNFHEIINATIDSKAIVVTETSIRSSLLFNDADGDQPPVTDSSSSHDTTQDSKDSLEGTNGSEGDQELSVLFTNLSNRVLALEASKDAQAAKIIKLKTRIKKLKKKSHPVILHHRAWLRSMSRLSMKRKLGRKEFVSKQGRKNAKPGPTLDDSTFDDLDANH
ncbi:hypothetical protein Tco_0028465, partial [Tanacetum coccineum]